MGYCHSFSSVQSECSVTHSVACNQSALGLLGGCEQCCTAATEMPLGLISRWGAQQMFMQLQQPQKCNTWYYEWPLLGPKSSSQDTAILTAITMFTATGLEYKLSLRSVWLIVLFLFFFIQFWLLFQTKLWTAFPITTVGSFSMQHLASIFQRTLDSFSHLNLGNLFPLKLGHISHQNCAYHLPWKGEGCHTD